MRPVLEIQRIDLVVVGYMLLKVLLIGLIALYVNKPTLFTIVYFQLPRATKWLLAFLFGSLWVLFAGIAWLPIGVVITLMVGFTLEKQERFAVLKLRI